MNQPLKHGHKSGGKNHEIKQFHIKHKLSEIFISFKHFYKYLFQHLLINLNGVKSHDANHGFLSL